ncbi:MAG: LLM class flavin-dependent oxidoreductase [Solirubrobacteraceae bacterium]
MEVWLHGFAFPQRVAELARQAEAWGFTGLLIADSQNLTADVWVELALAGAATSRLRLGPGVTNPITRHLAVTASAAATLQAETGGRAVLGLAQGDSALTQIGHQRLSVESFEAALQTLQGLLGDEDVQLNEHTRSRIRWLAEIGAAKVPVHVAATGPRTIEAAARHAEGVDLTVGAELHRIRRCAEQARAVAVSTLTVGAYLNVAVDEDPAAARALVRGSVATFARFSASAASGSELSAVDRRDVAKITAGYDPDRHGDSRAESAQSIADEFIDRFAVAGTPDEVLRRLRAISNSGIERVIVVPGSLDSDPSRVHRSLDRFAADVLPKLLD